MKGDLSLFDAPFFGITSAEADVSESLESELKR